METEVLKEFLVKLGFNIDENSLNNFNSSIIKASAGVMAFGVAVTAMASEIVHTVQEVANQYKQLDLLAKQLNTTAEAVDGFIDTAGVMGISEETATESLKSMSRAVEDAGMGIGRSKVIFEKLGISVTDANGKVRGTMDVMSDLQVKMQGMGRGEQLRVMERLGLDPKMLLMFNASLEKTKYIGGELSKIDVAAGFNLDKSIAESKAFSASWKDMRMEINLFKTLFDKIKEAIAVYLMPKIREAIEKITSTIHDMRNEVMELAPKIEAFIKPLLTMILNLADGFVRLGARGIKVVIDLAKMLINTFLEVNEKTDGLIGIVGGLVVGWQLLNKVFLSSPIGRIILLSVAILALYDDFLTFKEGGDSLINWNSDFAQGALEVVKVLGYVAGAVLAVKGAMMVYGVAIKMVTMFTTVWRTAQMALNFILSANPIGLIIIAIAALGVAGYELVKHWKVVKDFFTGLFSSVGKSFDKISKMGSAVSGFFGSNSTVLKPSDASTGSSVNQQTVIHVHGNANPQATAQAVATHQSNVNQNLTRNATARAR